MKQCTAFCGLSARAVTMKRLFHIAVRAAAFVQVALANAAPRLVLAGRK